MTPSEIAELFENNPTTAFRLTLSSGDVVDVDNPRRTIIESLALYVGKPTSQTLVLPSGSESCPFRTSR